MTDSERMSLRAVPPRELTPARVLAHHALQWLARSARAAIEPIADDSHTNLGWEAEHGALTTRSIATGRLGLRVADLTLLRIGSSDIADSFALDGKTEAEAGRWIDDALKGLGHDGSVREVRLPYDLPPHEVMTGGTYDVSEQSPRLAQLAVWFATAHDLLQEITCDAAAAGSPVRCWPHHFDIATLISFERGDPETARSIGVGLSPGDESYDQPYFYVNPWPPLDPGNLPAVPPPGQWHTRDFVGAVAPGEALAGLTDPRAESLTFLRGAIEAGRARLGVPG